MLAPVFICELISACSIRGQKRMSDTLELELQMPVNCLVVLGIKPTQENKDPHPLSPVSHGILTCFKT